MVAECHAVAIFLALRVSIALLSAELDQLRLHRKDVAPDVREEMTRLVAEAGEIGAELHRLSHELRTSSSTVERGMLDCA
jgi:hypothetical protein